VPGSGQRALRWFCLLLAVLGIGISAYLTAEHYSGNTTLACSDTGTVNCLKVTTSPQSVFLGVPVALWGLLYWCAVAVLVLPLAFRWPWLHRVRIAAAVGGIGFVVYLVYSELFTIDAICLWCSAVHVVTLLFLVAVLLVDPYADRA
jgi:uncharacterized membrane protein